MNQTSAIILAAAAVVLAAPAGAVVIPEGGATFETMWDSPVGIDLDPTIPVTIDDDAEATITLTEASVIDVNVFDTGVTGDAFALFLNGVELTPTSGNLGPETRGPDATEFFDALYDDVPLIAGLNVFTLELTDSCCDGGGSSIVFGPLGGDDIPSMGDVPLPMTAWLLLTGVAGLATVRAGRG